MNTRFMIFIFLLAGVVCFTDLIKVFNRPGSRFVKILKIG